METQEFEINGINKEEFIEIQEAEQKIIEAMGVPSRMLGKKEEIERLAHTAVELYELKGNYGNI